MESIKITTYWQPLGETYWNRFETTLYEATNSKADWVTEIEKGSTYIIKNYRNSANPGTLIVIANVK